MRMLIGGNSAKIPSGKITTVIVFMKIINDMRIKRIGFL
jgi:hypothetical protein